MAKVRHRTHKLRKVGDSLIVTMPREFVGVLKAVEGDMLLWIWCDGDDYLRVRLADTEA